MIKIEQQVLLKDFSPFGIGGPSQHFVAVHTVEELLEAINHAKKKKLPFFLLGRGSNCLFDDRGYKGLVIKNAIDFLHFNKETLSVGSGLFLPYLSMCCSERDLSGFEFAAGIPGSVGGALYMNASAHGQSISSVLRKVTVLTSDGLIEEKEATSLHFGYRFSSFQHSNEMILSATFQLSPSIDVKERVKTFLLERKAKQPLGEKSLGSIFKNPNSKLSAGALIDLCGLKGERVGGASVSQKHANFIINDQEASSRDVLRLIEIIEQNVKETQGIILEKEIVLVPYEETHE